MTRKERNKVTMYNTVSQWLADHSDALTGLPNMEATLGEFNEDISSIKSLDSNVVSDTSGLTQDKEAIKDEVASKSLIVVRMLKAYATFKKDRVLLNSIDFTKSQLFYASDQVLQSRAALLVQTAKGTKNGAKSYGLTQAVIEDLEASATAFSGRVTNPRQAVISKKDTREQLAALIDEVDNLLAEKLDVLMDLVGISRPELLNQYNAARVIVDR